MNDIIGLELDGGGTKVAPPVLQRLKAAHHMAARLVAEGKSAIEVANIVNRTPQSIRDLTRLDPAFQGLVKYYQDQLTEIGMEESTRIQAKLRLVAEAATDELIDRLGDDGKRAAMSTDTVRQVAAMGLDRTVAPPKTAQPIVSVPTKITFNIGTRNLDPNSGDAKVIEHEDGKGTNDGNDGEG